MSCESVSCDGGPSVTPVAPEKLKICRKLVTLHAIHLLNLQKAIFLNRRRSQQRLRRRQATLRSFYVRQLVELEATFLELLSLAGLPKTIGTSPTTHGAATPAKRRFYEDVVSHFSGTEWLRTFRMSRRLFDWICAKFHDVLSADANAAPLGGRFLRKSIALVLYALATGERFSSVARRFDVQTPLVGQLVKLFADVVLQKLGPCLIAMPKKEEEFQDIRRGFQQASNMPAAMVGALDCLVLPIGGGSTTTAAPPRKKPKCSAVLLQTLVDDRLLFRRVQVQKEKHTLFLEAPNAISRLEPQLINERFVPCFVVTPARYYPLRLWLMQRYEEPIAPHEYDFNEAVDNALIFKDTALRRLLGRWQILQRRQNFELRTMEVIALTCCALHNLLEEGDEEYLPQWEAGLDLGRYSVDRDVRPGASETEAAAELRDFLARTISSTEY